MITIINFSSRQNGNCYNIGKIISEQYSQTVFYDFSSFVIKGCGNCEYQCFKDNQNCYLNDQINKIYQSIMDSELVYYLIPNYCDYPSANYFIFNERKCGFFQKDSKLLDKYLAIPKKFIVVSNTSFDNFKDILKDHIQENQKLDILFLSTKKFNSSSMADDLMSNPSAKQVILAYINNHYKLEESCMAVVLYKNKILTTTELIYERVVLSLPKGHIEKGESHIEVAIRECFEETNVIVKKEDVVTELAAYSIEFIDHHYNLVRKTIYPIVFKIDNYQDIRSKERRIKKIEFMDIIEFYYNCSYNNVREIVTNALKINK